jgi:death-on-curing protein
VRYLSLAEAILIAEAVTGIDTTTLSHVARVDLLDSALHAPQAGFADEDFYPTLAEKAAVLVVRIAKNHPLPDGNKRLAWQSLRVFLAINGVHFDVSTDDAVSLMLGIAAGDRSQDDVTDWISDHIDPAPRV